MIAEDITVEWDEGGCFLHVDGETWRVADPEALYDRVKAAILPWLMERDEAWGEFKQALRSGTGPAAAFVCRDVDESGGYDTSDPKHPDFYSVHVDHYDAREGK